MLDLETLRLQYAGAHQPLYRIHQGSLQVIEADRQPVAIYTREKAFRNHILQLQPSDCLYLSTDGFADQLGGGAERKFLARNFRQLLLQMHQLPMSDQQEYLQRAFDT